MMMLFMLIMIYAKFKQNNSAVHAAIDLYQNLNLKMLLRNTKYLK